MVDVIDLVRYRPLAFAERQRDSQPVGARSTPDKPIRNSSLDLRTRGRRHRRSSTTGAVL